MHLYFVLSLTHLVVLLRCSGMFSDGFFSYGIEPLHNDSNQVKV